MSLVGHLRDPLSLNPKSQWLAFTSKFPDWSSTSQTDPVDTSSGEILSLASKFLLLSPCTAIVADTFRPLLLDLCARWLESSEALEEKLSALCFLLQPHTEIFPILSAFLQEFVPKSGPLSAIIASIPLEAVPPSRLHRLLLAYYRILMANPELPKWLDWPLEPLSRLFWEPHPDIGVRYLAIRCYAMQSGMCEAEREKLENTIIGSMAHTECRLEFGQDLHGNANVIDGWLLPVIEKQRIHDSLNSIASDTKDFTKEQGDNCLRPSDLSPLVVNIHGVLMFRPSTTAATPATPLVPTNTSVNALRALALYVSPRLPVLLTSTPSSGKTLLLSHLASTLYPDVKNQLVTINLADTSVDGRSLLGSYVQSTRTPGTFEWKEGVLVRAMKTGRWVILQDIDKGSNEVLGTLNALVESLGMGKWVGGRAKLVVPSRGEVVASDSFAIFATRSLSTSRDDSFPTPTFFGAHKFHEVIIPTPSQEELCTIVAASYPKLSGPAAAGIVMLWSAIKAEGSTTTDRVIGLRDLRKYCTRSEALLPSSYRSIVPDSPDAQLDYVGILVSIFLNPTLREAMFLEARDVFFGAGSLTAASRTRTTAIAAIVAEHLGLTQEKCDWLLSQHVPEVVNEMDSNGRTTSVRLGRIGLPVQTAKSDISLPPTRPFVVHRPAAILMSRIATCISTGEPVLLTGETGTGKTSIITHLASLLHHPLISLNLSQQTESSDLLGSFKPIDARIPGSELQLRFLDLFRSTFSQKKNVKFEESTWRAVKDGKWKRAAGLWKESVRLAKDRIRSRLSEATRGDSPDVLDSETPRKRRRMEEAHFHESERNWSAFEREVLQFEAQYATKKAKFAFGFVEGPLVRALRSGDWILLDEINLASTETLEAVSTLLRDPASSITLTEQGSMEPVPRHPSFRIFACMNPATDAGKKELPPSIRSYFTEIDVPPPDADRETLLAVITQYIGPSAVSDKAAIMDVAEFYTAVKALTANRQIADASNRRPHFNMRTLTRALTFAAEIASAYSLRRAMWEGCLMAFTMALDVPSTELVTNLAQKHVLNGIRNVRLLLTREPAPPRSRPLADFVKFGPFYLEKGDLAELPTDDYIMTPSVERKLIDLARIISTRRFPVLIEGPTSSGKTSTVEYLAKRTGHRFVRINNHEHTDIQEYLGTYVSDPVSGKLIFKDGLLLQALRRGDWIVLDELNLAPTDVLEALNRLLDDNRELFIPETQEVIKPHPHFMLFATQNPPGLYAGRKVLSRAFRSRFLEVHFDDVPQAELETILCQRCRIAPSYAQRIIAVFRELQKRRQTSRVFESKQGFATLRDLFRWAGRDAVGYQELAENGYMLLAERARREDDRAVVKNVIESIMKVRIDEATLYSFDRFGDDVKGFLGFDISSSSNIVWTKAMQRLLILVGRALRSREPVLLVGDTGSGKTSICQVYANAIDKHLLSINCHQNTETADLIGGLRPIRNKAAVEAETFSEVSSLLLQCGVTGVPNNAASLLSAIDQLEDSQIVDSIKREVRQKLRRITGIFEWHDGPLVDAMKAGDVLLLDEISLADDSVLERLNSVLEPARTIVLAEKGGDNVEDSVVQAALDFRLIATMNPGGDYGKKELSPALRNRFTEIWVPAVNERADLTQIILSSWRHENLKPYTPLVLDFMEWLSRRVSEPSLFGLRDIIAWITFSNSVLDNGAMKAMPPNEIFHHAAHMVCLDGMGSLPALSGYSMITLRKIKDDALQKLQEMVPISPEGPSSYTPSHDMDRFIQLGPFAIPKGPEKPAPHSYDIQAPTTRDNAMRLVRASQLSKPILLEGSPGVGKTSVITTLANICGYHLCRINLSDQTDLADLFGADLPVDGGRPGEFAWKEADFLKAMQNGDWVLLDEMNLAPQSVLEGLNAVLDHRGAVYVPELGRSFSRHPSFRIFAAQNPIQQGGGRKGLPKSFVNRFTKVFVDPLTPADLLQISKHMFPNYPEEWLQRMIVYNSRLEEETSVKRSFGRNGSPWEFNLRDISRWGVLLHGTDSLLHPVEHLRTVYLSRFRTISDRESARALFDSVFNLSSNFLSNAPHPFISSSNSRIGHFIEGRKSSFTSSFRPGIILQAHLPWIEAMGVALQQGWLVIISGPLNSGKTSLVRAMAELTGNPLQEVSINHATDTTDILGSYEQVDGNYRALELVRRALQLSERVSRTSGGSKSRTLLNLGLLRSALVNPPPNESLSELLRTTSSTVEGLVDMDDHGIREKNDLQEGIRAELAASNIAGRFEWVDGPLVRALKEGHWLLLDNANLCSPSVLDRLNSLCEPSGVLVLNERGLVDGKTPIIVPHPNFRMIMCIDPQLGELSRAMRNRGLEISLSPSRSQEDLCRIQEFHFLPSPSRSDSSQISPLEFEILRRCLQNVSSTTMPSTWLPATAIVGDSSASSIVDRASLILPRDITTLQAPPLAVLNFFVRSMIPAYADHLSRFISGLCSSDRSGPLRNLHLMLDVAREDSVWSKLEQTRKIILPASSILCPTQPMDFFMKSTTAAFPPKGSHHLTDESTILCIFELLVRTTYDDFNDASSVRSNVPDDNRIDSLSNTIRNRIDEFTKVIHQHGANLLQDSPNHLSQELPAEVQLIIDLLKYTTFFRRQPHSSVNFSLLQAVSSWIQEALRSTPVHLPNINRSAELLSRAVASTSGLGLSDIWSSWTSSVGPSSYTPELEQAILDTDDSEDGYKIRSQLLEHIITKYLRTKTTPFADPDPRDAPMLSEEQSTSRRIPTLKIEGPMTNKISVIKELGALTHMPDGDSLTVLDQIIDLACSEHRMSLKRFIPYRHATLAMQSGQCADAGTILSAFGSWLQALWEHGDPGGPSTLFQPTGLSMTMQACDLHGVTLQSVGAHQRALEHHSRLFTVSGNQGSTRIEDMKTLLRKTLLLLSSCFHQSFDESTLKDLQGAYRDSHSFAGLLPLLRRSSYPWVVLSVDRLFSGPIAQISREESRSVTLRNLGLGWISLSRFFLDLYIPDTPLDPAALQSFRSEFWGSELASLSRELDLEVNLERRISGNTTNGTINYLEEQIRHVRESAHNVPHLPRMAGRDIFRLREFWSEVSHFMLKIIPEARLNHLVDSFYANSPEASASEHVIQESIARFHQRLGSAYPEFDDISRPLRSALLYIRLGLRLVAHASGCHEAETIEELSCALTAFPSVGAVPALIDADIRGDLRAVETSPFKSILLVLTAVAFEVELGIDPRIAVIESVYERASRLWLIDQKKQEEADVASQSLYRTSGISHSARNESELEEEDFLALFPDYESLFDPDPNQEIGPSHVVRQSSPPDKSYASSLMLLHLRIMSPESHLLDPQTHLSDLRAALLPSILDKYQKCLPETLDDHAFTHQVSLLSACLRNLNHPNGMEYVRPYNFYVDSNAPEIRRAATVVESLKQRLDHLIQEWPDQMVLQHLKDRCTQILSLSIQSPVAKVLTLIEQLLLQTDDWEMYASQENTLKKHRSAITDLVIFWRRLELSSWRGLLRTQAITFEEGVSDWWFRLYNAVVRGLLDIVDRSCLDSLDDYLDQLVPLLDGFLTSSPLGQFSRRLDLLRSFGPFLQHLILTKPEFAGEPIRRVQRIIHSTQGYYSQFVSSITSSLTSQEKTVSEEIQGFIKIASWKDVNVQALKVSAKKTHHQLYKAIRKYRDILRQPVNDLLRPVPVSDKGIASDARLLPQSLSTIDSTVLIGHVAPDGPAHLRDLSKTYMRFDSLITSRVEAFIKSRPSHELDALMEQTISTAKELASVNIPAGATAERKEKLWKGLLVRKRKAWSDFAKEFKRIGLATKVQSTILLRQKNDRWLREQPFPAKGADSFADVQNSEKHLVRLQGLLPMLRATLVDHHGDVSTRELQRSIMLLESALCTSLSCRSKLAIYLNDYARLKCILQRLSSLQQSSGISAWGPSVLDTVLSTAEIVTRMCHAISETIHKIKDFGDLPGASPVPASFLESAETLLSSTQESRNALRSIVINLKEAELPILLRDEHDTVVLAQRHITDSRNLFYEWEKSHPQLRLIISPLRDWLASQILHTLRGNQLSDSSDRGSDEVIEALLKSIQSVYSAIPAENQFLIPSQDSYLKDTSYSLIRVGDLLHVDSKVALMHSLIDRLAGRPLEELKTNVSRLLPFAQRYTLLVEEHLLSMASWVNSLFKLQLTACSVMLNIATNGFCKPPDGEESGEGETKDESGLAGVGLGEGEGKESVNKEIEDESQVEGLKDESGESQRKRDEGSEGGDDAIEVGDDFQGELESLPESGSEEEEPADDDEEGPEDTLGDLDVGDPDAIDEKLWGDETGTQDDGKQEKTSEDQSSKISANTEMVAKENERPKDDRHSPEKNHDNGETRDEAMPGDEAEEDNGEEAPGDSGAQLDDFVQDSDILDLPDGLEMDEDTMPQDPVEDVDDKMFGDEPDPADSPTGEDEPQPESSPETSQPMDKTTEEESLDGQRQEGEKTEAEKDDSYPEEDVIMQPDVGTGDGTSDQDIPDSSLDSNFHEDSSERPSGSAMGAKAAGISEEARGDETMARDEKMTVEKGGGGSANASTEAGTAPCLDKVLQSVPNDNARSLGDASKETIRHSDEILENDSATAEQTMADLKSSHLQYLHENDVDHDMQALGPAGAEEVAKLSELQLKDDADESNNAIQMDVDDQEHPTSQHGLIPPPLHPSEPPERPPQEETPGLLPQNQVPSQRPLYGADFPTERDALIAEDDDEVQQSEHVELALRQWQAEGQPPEGAQNLWRLYESLTQDLSYALCEQLRLILEPTLATRLKGDYRSGKRLNMKKIIPYIASEYTKDKIWLKRTRPSQREYQVFLVLDDSRSMAESHSIHLAYETLALVSKALSRLEVGDIGVAKFGETVDLLHGFDDGPLTDQAAIRVMTAFTFNQKATDVLALVDSSLGILEAARESRSTKSSSAGDLWQLEIIISDGLCQNHEKLRAALRRAQEQRVMMVFVIVDSLHSNAASSTAGLEASEKGTTQNSILSMQQVAYKNVDGRMELQMQRYLDTFPFDYYVVLRDVEALPEVLSGTVKQFFERISDV